MMFFVPFQWLKVIALHHEVSINESLFGLVVFLFGCCLKFQLPQYLDNHTLAFLRATGLNKLLVEDTMLTITKSDIGLLDYILDRLPQGKPITAAC